MKEELEVKNEDGAKCGKSDQERVVMCDRAFKAAIAPYIEQRLKIYNHCSSLTTYWVNGSLKYAHNFNEAEQAILDLINECIEQKRRDIFNT